LFTRKSVKVDDLELQIEKEIEKYTILPEFLDWALEGINVKNDTEIEDEQKYTKCNTRHYLNTKLIWMN